MCHSDFFCVLSVAFYRRFQFVKKEIQISKIFFSVRVERYIPTTECSHSFKHFADVWDDLLCTVKLRYFNSTGVFSSDSLMLDQLFKLILRFIGQRFRPPSFSYILMSGPLSLSLCLTKSWYRPKSKNYSSSLAFCSLGQLSNECRTDGQIFIVLVKLNYSMAC